jgi:signal peptidase I
LIWEFLLKMAYKISKDLKDNKYLIQTSPSVVDVLKENSKIDAINRIIPEHVYQDKVYPRNDVFKWSPILYGPVLTPQIGTEIVLNPENIALYKYLIINFERKKLDVLDDGKVYIDDEEKISYTFENDYYFALGDNRDDAIDSRFIGFIPESHIVGITSSILISFDDQTGAIRFGHVFKSIN